ncbi:MAG: hypothetical protein P8X89_22380 [Reinekea sp.]
MSKQTLSDIFPELKDPEWIKDREECWQLALDKGDWKSEYRKKDLEKIKHYFFTGEILEGFPFPEKWLRLLKLFPIQTKAGYDYYYQTHDFTESQLESNVNSAFLDQQTADSRQQAAGSRQQTCVGRSKRRILIIMLAFFSLSAKFNKYLRKK